jgi:phosphoribosylanthranilate isomerase
MEPRTLQQTIDDMRRHIRRMTAEGFHTPEEIATSAVEVFLGEQAQDVLEPIAERMTRDAVQTHLDAQKEWPAITDCDLLDRAFGELDRAGIVARQHFTCCGT